MRHVVSAVIGSLLVSTASFAAKPPPPPPPTPPDIQVAYRLPDGKGTKLVVSTESGANQMTLFRSSGSFAFDLAPRGQMKVAILDGQPLRLKVLNYSVNTSGVYVPGTITTLGPAGPSSAVDFSPDGTKIAYTCCAGSDPQQLLVRDILAGTDTVWAEGAFYMDVAWFRGGASIAYSTLLPLEVREVTAPMATPVLLHSGSQGQFNIDAARTAPNQNQLVISHNDNQGNGRIGLWENGSFINADLVNSNKSWQGTLNCTDTKLAYMGVQNTSGSQAFYIRDLNSGSTTLVSKNSNILLQFWPTC